MIRPEFRKARRRAALTRSTRHAPRSTAWLYLSLLCFVVLGSLGETATPAHAATFVERAQEYVNGGNLKAAEIELKNALQRDPNDAEARFLLGKVHLGLGDPISAEKELLWARELGFVGDDLELMLAYSRLKQRRYEDVVGEVSGGITIDNDIQKELFVARGEALLGLGKFEEAEEVFDRVLREGAHGRALANKARISIQIGDLSKARRELDLAIAADPDAPLVVFADASWYFRSQQYRRAQERFSRVAELDQSNLIARIGEVQSLLALGELAEAQKLLSTLKTTNRDNPLLVLQSSILHFIQGNFKGAKTEAEFVLAAADKQPQALLVSGYSSFQLRQYEQARTRLLAYLAVRPQDNQARMILGVAMLRLGRTEEAYGAVSEFSSEVPDNVDFLNVLTAAAYLSGDEAAGLSYLERLAVKEPQNPEIHERLGVGKARAGDFDGAISAFKQSIAVDQSRLAAYKGLFSIYLMQKQTDDALRLALDVKEKFPNSALGEALSGVAYVAMDDPANAKAAFERGLDAEPGNPEIAGNLAAILQQEGDVAGAVAALDGVLRVDPQHLDTLLRYSAIEELADNRQKAEDLLRKAVAFHPQNPEPRLRLAQAYLRWGQPAAALNTVTPLAAEATSNPKVSEVVGLARLRSGDKTGALTAFQTLASQRPNSVAAMLYLMAAQEENQHISAALATSERILEIDQANVPARFGRIRFLAQLGKLQEAKNALAALKQGKGFDDKVQLIMVEGRIALAERRFSDALQAFEKCPKLWRSGEVFAEIIRTKLALGEIDNSVSMMRDWLEEFPDDLLIRNILAELYLAKRDLASAKKQYEAVLDRTANNAWALNNLAWIEIELGEPGRALPLAQQARGLAPGDPNTADTLALAHLELGDKPKALELLREATEGDPNSPSIRYHLARALAENGDVDGAIAILRPLLDTGARFYDRDRAQRYLETLTD